MKYILIMFLLMVFWSCTSNKSERSNDFEIIEEDSDKSENDVVDTDLDKVEPDSDIWTSADDETETAVWLDGNKHDGGYSVSVDSDGNIYVAGLIEANRTGSRLYPSGKIFLTKFNNDKTFAWTKIWGDSLNNRQPSVAIDNIGNVFVAGTTEENLDGNMNKGLYDIFVTKFTHDGIKEWTKLFGTEKSDWSNAISIDSTGNLYVAGYTEGNFDGNKNAVENCKVDEEECKDIFLLKINLDGIRIWTKQWGTESDESAKAIAIDRDNSIYVTGYTKGGLDGNTRAGGNCDPYLCGDIFLTKFENNGNKLWTKQIGKEGEETGESLAIDSKGNVYIAGQNLKKLNNKGDEEWTSTSKGNFVAIDASDNIYVINAGSNYTFPVLIKFLSDGFSGWEKSLDSLGYGVECNSIATDLLGNVFITGSFINDYWNGGSKDGQFDTFITKWNIVE